MIGFIIRALIAAVGLWLASKVVHGIGYDSLKSLLWAALLLGLANAVVRPILILLTLPFTIITLGLFLLVINGLMLLLVAHFIHGFHVHGLWNAILGSIVVGLTGWVGSWFIGAGGYEVRRRNRR
jgi:putative membrane protein